MPKQTEPAFSLPILALLIGIYGFSSIYTAQAESEHHEEGAKPLMLNIPLPDDIPLAYELVAPSQPALVDETSSIIESVGFPARKAPAEKPPSITPVILELDDAGIRAALEPMRIALRLSPAKVEGLVAAYASHNRQAFWLTQVDGIIRPLPGVEGVLTTLASAGQDGLDEHRLRNILPHVLGESISREKAAAYDLSMSFAAYLYAHDARGGRLEPSRLSPLLTPTLHLPDAEGLLIRLFEQPGEKVAAILRGYQPRHPGYAALRAQLAHVSALRQDDLIADILVNMERWRWLPPDLGENHIFVNVPDYQLSVVSSGAIIYQTRVIVGRAETPTPVFSDVMEYMIINPSWHVPPSILRKEFLPNLAKDPNYAARKGFEVVRNGNSISVRQPPGERNALGQIKFIFPNHHSVYLHDTPGRHLFAQESRAFSHGCVRVDAPFLLAERILAQQGGARVESLRAMVGKGERMIRIHNTWPVHLAYFTLSLDKQGALIRRKDIYGHDARMRAALLQDSSAAIATTARAP